MVPSITNTALARLVQSPKARTSTRQEPQARIENWKLMPSVPYT